MTTRTLRCCLVSIGSRGDVTPFIALGQALQAAGHEVVLVVLQPWQELVRSCGLECHPVPLGDEALWPSSPALRSLMIAQPGLMWAGMRHRAGRSAPQVVETLRAAAAEADVIVSGVLTRGATAALAVELRIPHATLLLAPLLPSADAARSVLAPAHLPAAPTRLVSTGLWRMTAAMGSGITRQMALELGSGAAADGQLTLVGATPVLSPPEPSWPSSVRQTGWLAPQGPTSALPGGLADWLAARPRAALMDFGSIPVARARADLELFRRTARMLDRPLVVQTPSLPPGCHGDGLWNAPGADHRTLMPLVDLVVHHGGAGTTGAALAAARPSVVVPHLGDQPYHARRVQQLGIGTSPGPRWRLTAKGLAAAVVTADDEAVRERCRVLGEQLRSEDGAARAAALVMQLVDA